MTNDPTSNSPEPLSEGPDGPEGVPTYIYDERFIAEHQSLFDRLSKDIIWDGRMRARKTASFGAPYNYSGMTYPAAKMHDALAEVRDAVGERLPFEPDNCLVNYYENGRSTMGFHYDEVDDLAPGTGVAIVSLGATRTLRFRKMHDREVEFARPLVSGSLLYMPPEVHTGWKHGIPRETGAGPRISLTYRQLVGE